MRRRAWLVALGWAALVIVGCSGRSDPAAILPLEDQPRLDVLGTAPEFSLPTTTGTLSRKSLSGSVWVAAFFFTSCQGVCPAMTSNFAELQRVFADQEEFKLVFFSVDPGNDTVATLRAFAQKWEAKPGKWFFAMPDAKQVETLAKDGFKLGATYVPGEILHSDRFVLIDRAGRIRGYYKGTDAEALSELVVDIKTLLNEPPVK